MSIRSFRSTATLALLAASLCAWYPARAAVPEPPGGEAAAKPAANDSTRLLPNWVHLHGAAGLGWLASPEWMRKFYQAGQGYELGLETRMGPSFRLRLNGEYQTMPAVTNASFSIITAASLDNAPARDTVLVEARTTGWLSSARLEAQMALTPHLWVLGGFGRGYLETGLHTTHVSDGVVSVDLVFPGSSGWVWLATAGTSYEFDVFGPRLSAEVRSSYLMRDQDRFQTWSIRLGWGWQ
jgi:hypothetical protein